MEVVKLPDECRLVGVQQPGPKRVLVLLFSGSTHPGLPS